MFVIWLVGLTLAVLAPVALGLAIWRLFDARTRPTALRALRGGAVGAVVGFIGSTLIEFMSERRFDSLDDYWYAYLAAGFTVGLLVGLLYAGWRAARERAQAAF